MPPIRKDKPWAHLRCSRRQYETAKPWKKTGLSRAAFEDMILGMPTEVIDDLLLYADVEKLSAAMGLPPEE